jgi:hypothetical protein
MKVAESVKIEEDILNKYRVWAKDSGRTLMSLMCEALQFGYEKQSEIERRFALRVQSGKKGAA